MSASRSAIGRRVVVTGLAGSGKSTLAVALAAKTGLPVIHLDLAFWKPGWVASSESEWREKQRVVLAGDAWIADGNGNYHETLDLRLGHADTLVVLDMPWWLCSGRVLLRGFRMPGELPEGCDYSAWARLRDEWRLAGRARSLRRSDTYRAVADDGWMSLNCSPQRRISDMQLSPTVFGPMWNRANSIDVTTPGGATVGNAIASGFRGRSGQV